ncbi:hypothetical protein IFM89_032013 [Coptis chinensis]|uniref:Uncharacterized protein n=1 Tax=Coptis chinensis TaxID=261450 RepID=A0A835H140_9MAGN|nr:hypothetical protein IFM89_032013 [Coptis chinensis]
MSQNPSTSIMPSSLLLPSQWPTPHNDEVSLAMEESEYEVKLNEIRNANSNFVVIGKTSVENEKEEVDNEADDDEADNAEESEGDEFEQETG